MHILVYRYITIHTELFYLLYIINKFEKIFHFDLILVTKQT